MPDRDGYPPGVPCWVDTTQADPDAAASFYPDLFGWEVEGVMPPGADGKYYMGRIRGRDVAAVSSPTGDGPPFATWNTYVSVESADETARKAREAGGRVLADPFDVMESGRMAVLADPEGAVISAWEPKEHQGSRVVNEHGSVNFNVLSTRDVEAAKAFYGAVFGWETLDFGGSDGMWTLPGYGDHLEELTPGLRERNAGFGAPAGFEDVVAALNPLGDEDGETPAHWGVTFGVDDADDAAKRAQELGAEIVVPPMDAPWVRIAVIRDPQGATFVASQFVPENRELG